MKIKPLLALYLLGTSTAFACDEPQTISNLKAVITEKLLTNAPTFRHGWEDKTIQLTILNAKKVADACQATLQITLPQQDINEVNAELDAQPAKRILLGAQGYAVPDNTVSAVEYFYRVENHNVIAQNNDNQALKALLSSIEYMYQSLAQSRIVLAENAANTLAWQDADKKFANDACKSTFNLSATNTSSLDAACACRSEKLSGILSARQMELVIFVQNQPYSAATGALKTFINASKPINETCGLVSKK